MKYASLLVPVLVLAFAACGRDDGDVAQVRSHLEGRLTVDADVDSVADYGAFEVLVARQVDGEPDTLGYATTDSTGRFATTVTAPERGVYSIVISRRGTILKVGELVVAGGDTATVEAEFPIGRRLLRIRSAENAAWTAYKNTKAQYNQALAERLQGGEVDVAQLNRDVGMTSTILWSLRETYPNTVGAEIAAAESVTMLEGWSDSLLVDRARQIESTNPSYVAVARAARRAQARMAGQEAALALLDDFAARAPGAEEKAGIQSEVVVAYADSLQQQDALEAARALREEYGETAWADWADRAIYEIENLMPGMEAPDFTLTTTDGREVSLASVRGRPVVLEFYLPQDPQYRQQLPTRNALAAISGSDSLQFVSVSLEADTLLNEAFREGRDLPGLHVVLPDGFESAVAEAYNVSVLPTRVLIDGEGLIVRKYVGSTLARMQDDLLALFSENTPPA